MSETLRYNGDFVLQLERLNYQELIEKQILKDRNVFVTGAASKMGTALTIELLNMGARVIRGSRTKKRLEESQEEIEKTVANPKVIDFVANVANTKDLSRALDELKYHLDGENVTDHVSGAASGVGLYKKEFMYYFLNLKKSIGDGEIGYDDYLLAEEQCRIWGEKHHDETHRVNTVAPIVVMDTMIAKNMFGKNGSGKGGRGLLDCSTISYACGKGYKPPFFYDTIGPTKNAGEMLWKNTAPEYASRGIRLGQVIAPLVDDSEMGFMLRRVFTPLLPKHLKERAAVYLNGVNSIDVAKGTAMLLAESSAWYGYPELFILGTIEGDQGKINKGSLFSSLPAHIDQALSIPFSYYPNQLTT